jgi:ADP-heptose:LPS heptosyltransferase
LYIPYVEDLNIVAQKESIYHTPWSSTIPPKKILVIRLQAFGDVVITLPYVQALQSFMPTTQFHFLTREEFSAIPFNMTMFDHVFSLGGGRNPKRQWLKAITLIPSLLRERYDIVIDLQRNSLSRLIRRTLRPKSFCEFDRFSLQTAGERTRQTIEKLGIAQLRDTLPKLKLCNYDIGLHKLQATNFDPAKKLFVVNPAGNFTTKNWPLEYYIQFARTWLDTRDTHVQFLILGVDSLQTKADHLKDQLGNNLISLIGTTTQAEAFNILQHTDLVLTEDSGLMHLACAAQVPVVALFGSTKSLWSKPWGNYARCLDSSDLECGECAEPLCRFGDVHCLTRTTPNQVIKIAQDLLQQKDSDTRAHR